METFDELTDCKLFKGLNKGELTHILNITTHQVKEYNQGSIIAMAGEQVKHLIIVEKGAVKGEMIDFSGKTIKIENIEAPQTIAQAFLFGNNNYFPVNVVAMNNCSLVFIPKESLLKMLQQNKQIMLNYLNIISNRAQFLSDKLKFLSFNTLKEKVAHFILQLSRGDELTTVELPSKQQDLAEMFGVARPSLGRTLNELKQEGIIEMEKGMITILSRSKLIGIIKNIA